MPNPQLLIIASSLALSLGACASSGSPAMDAGERISQRGSDIGGYGDAWSHGQKDVSRGENAIKQSSKRLADGEKDLARANAQVVKAEQQIRDARTARADGEKLVQNGSSQMQRAEANYTSIRAGPAAVD